MSKLDFEMNFNINKIIASRGHNKIPIDVREDSKLKKFMNGIGSAIKSCVKAMFSLIMAYIIIILRVIIFIACISGFINQFVNLTKIYWKYETTNKI